MVIMNYHVEFLTQKGNRFKLGMLESITVKKSVENLADTATIVLPGSEYNKTLSLEESVSEGDSVSIRFGYDKSGKELPVEFEGYVESINTDGGSITINCEDEIYSLRKELKDEVLENIKLKSLLEHVLQQADVKIGVDCKYDITYGKFTIYGATIYDVIKKVQEETKANVYLVGKTLYVDPQYSRLSNTVIYDFAVNIEKADLKYRDESKRKFLVTVEGSDADGKAIKGQAGKQGGDAVNIKFSAISTQESLNAIAQETLKSKSYTGYEGNFTGWLLPGVKPTDVAELRDKEEVYKSGKYYVLSVETKFDKSGGSRKITIGKNLQT